MSDPVYAQLCERLNRFESKVPPVASLFEMLEEIYSIEEAELATIFPDGAFTAVQLADHLKKDDVSQLTSMLETMADKGQVFVMHTDAEGKKYELSPWMPGVIEFSIIRRMNTPKMKTMLDLSAKMREEFYALIEPFTHDPEMLKTMFTDASIRTLPVGESLPDKQVIYPYENVLQMIDKEESFAVARCCCRHMAEHQSEPCRVPGVPEYSCLTFGRVADFVVERDFGKRITKDECKEIVKTCAEKGLVHNSNNFIEGMQFICNCCSCCCQFIRLVKDIGNINIINASNYLSMFDDAICIGCGDCVERCPTKAITLKEDIASVEQASCIGCGNCVAVCPTSALTLCRVSDKKPGLGKRHVGLGS
jgi:ferredoxin